MTRALACCFAAALLVPFVVYGVARATGQLPSRVEWEALGGKHGPWHSSRVMCPHALSHEFQGAPYPPEHASCDRKSLLLAVLGGAYNVIWFAIPLLSVGALVSFVLMAIRRHEPLAALPGVLIFLAGVAGWVLQTLYVAWVSHY